MEGRDNERRRTKFIFHRVGHHRPSGKAGERLRELETKAEAQHRLSEKEMAELARLTQVRQLEGPELHLLGVTDVDATLANLEDIDDRADFAYQNYFALEAISLRLLMLDFFLRMYVVHKTQEPIDPHSKIQFGTLINKAENSGLSEDLVNRLRVFNEGRKAGIHNLLLGHAYLQEVADAYPPTNGLWESILDAMELPPHEPG